MHYIVMDLEWNQTLFQRRSLYRRTGRELMFDIIQIGAVKMDGERRLIASFNQYVQPGCWRKLHPRIARITGITQEDLSSAPGFREAYEKFIDWCGDDFTLTTWGGDDISVFQQNIDHYIKDVCLMPPIYDLQLLFGAANGDGRDRAGLQKAMARNEIRPSLDQPFHSAVSDAYYAALVFQRLPDAGAIMGFQQEAREAAPMKDGKNMKSDDLSFSSIPDALESKPARQPNCPVCAKRLSVQEGYVPMRDGIWRALADCPDHGLVLIDLILVAPASGKPFVRRRALLSEQQNPAYVKTKHLQWEGKVSALRESEETA